MNIGRSLKLEDRSSLEVRQLKSSNEEFKAHKLFVLNLATSFFRNINCQIGPCGVLEILSLTSISRLHSLKAKEYQDKEVLYQSSAE